MPERWVRCVVLVEDDDGGWRGGGRVGRVFASGGVELREGGGGDGWWSEGVEVGGERGWRETDG